MEDYLADCGCRVQDGVLLLACNNHIEYFIEQTMPEDMDQGDEWGVEVHTDDF